MNESWRERIRQFLLNRWAKRYDPRLANASPRLGFGVVTFPEATYVFEHSDCNAERNHCAGAIVAVWLVDKAGVRQAALSLSDVSRERRGMWYRFARQHFYIAPDGEWIVEELMDGPRAGCGGRSRVVSTGNTFVFASEGAWWKC